MSYERDKRNIVYIYIWARFELVPIVICKNRRFSICRDLVVTEKRVSTVIVVAIM